MSRSVTTRDGNWAYVLQIETGRNGPMECLSKTSQSVTVSRRNWAFLLQIEMFEVVS